MKILINNEEVVCSNLLEIKEEMLTTSSTILNNCYPKSWELDKNYVSRFYYPKDYSKCLIYDNEIYHPAITGETIKGNNFNINYDTNKDKKLLGIYGDLSQNGTPSPSTPIDIDVVTGLQKIQVCGKNLFNKNTITSGKLIQVDGTEVANTSYGASDFIKVTANTQYVRVNCNNYYGAFYDIHKNFVEAIQNQNVITPSVDGYVRISFLLTNIDSVQLEKGNQATTFEEYNGKEYEINLGKNILDATQQSYTLLANTNTYQTIHNTKPYLKANTKYYISYNIDNDSTSNTRSTPRLYLNQQYIESSNTNRNTTKGRKVWEFTPTVSGYYEVQYWLHTSNVDVTISNFMISTSSDLEYTPYFEPIELCKIGDYQDKIYKSNGKWYIEKKTTKAEMKTTDIWVYDSNNVVFYNMTPTNTYNENVTPYCNYFEGVASVINNGTAHNQGDGKCCFRKGTNDRLYFNKFDITSLNDFKTWLSSHPTFVYYVSATPETTEITNTELINQLENFAQFELFEGLNNISNNGNLPGDIELYYNFKDAYTQQDLLFSGIVKNTADISLNPREPHYANLQVLDFKTMLSEGDTLNFVITNKTILEAIQMVIETITTYGVILGNVNILNPNEIIEAYSTADKTAYDVFQYLAEISQSKWTTRLIDENTIAVDFYDPTLMPQANDILYTKQYFEDNNIQSIDFNYGTYDYRNKQTILSDQVYGSLDYEETILADGYSRTFDTNENIGYIKSINVDGVAKTFGTNEEKDAGFDYNFYYTPGSNKLEQNSNDSILVSNSEINIVYVPIIKGRQVIINDDEVERINTQTNRNGVISRYEKRNDILTSEGLTKIAQTYIKYKGSAEINLIVKTYNKDLFNVGQIVYFNAPIDALKKTYMVKRKIIQTYNTNETKQLFCEYELTSSYNSEREINYFDNQRNKSQGNIGLGQFITRNIDIDNTANIIFNNLSIEETTIDNTLNSVLNSPLNK